MCVEFDVCCGPLMGVGGGAALLVWLCEKMVDSVSVLSIYVNQLCNTASDANGNVLFRSALSIGVAAGPSRLLSA